MRNILVRYGAVLLVLFVWGCSDRNLSDPLFEHIDTIIMRLADDNIIEYPLIAKAEYEGYFIVSGPIYGAIGLDCAGSIRYKNNVKTFHYQAVPGKYYVVYPLFDKCNKISLLTVLRSPSSENSCRQHQVAPTNGTVLDFLVRTPIDTACSLW